MGSTLDARAAAGEGQTAIAEVTPTLARDAAAHTNTLHAALREALHRAAGGCVAEWRKGAGKRQALGGDAQAAFEVLDVESVRTAAHLTSMS